MIYLDPTALMRLISKHPETAALRDYLHTHTNSIWFTSAFTRIELVRAAAPLGDDAVDHADHILSGLDTVTITDHFLHQSAHLNPAPPQILDAVHITAALTAGNHLRAFLTYDPERATAARAHNIAALAPGGGTPCSGP